MGNLSLNGPGCLGTYTGSYGTTCALAGAGPSVTVTAVFRGCGHSHGGIGVIGRAPLGALAESIEGEAPVYGGSDDLRQQLARELHDSVVQTLQLMLVEMEQFKREQFDPQMVVNTVSGYQAHTREVLNELRELLYGLRDESVLETGFTDGIRSLIVNFEQRTGIHSQVTVSRGWPRALRRAAALNLRRVVEEGLTNIRRHSRANRCMVSLGELDVQTLLIQIRDNGIGLALDRDEGMEGIGLAGMRERVLLLGGRLSMDSSFGNGTVLRAAIPREGVT